MDITQKLKNTNQFKFSIYCMTAAFITYFSMYAFRKPFTAGTYDGLSLWGIDYKILLITIQVIGYMLSKFVGIRIVSSMHAKNRIKYILFLIGVSWLSLFFFGLVPYPFNFILLFFNGLPLGMIWGLVFAFLEGRKSTELLGAGMSASFIVSSGAVKAVGKYLIEGFDLSEFWMPFVAGMIFIPFLLVGVWMLSKIPPPNAEDRTLRTERVPMNRYERLHFFRVFAPGIILTVAIYVALTIIRDLRDNFAVELWASLGFGNDPGILATAEIPVAISVMIISSFMILIKNNRIAFFSTLGIIFLGGFLLLLITILFKLGYIPPVLWMILTGFGLYLSYVAYHTMLFERWIALFNYRSNIGYLMYVADAFGYLGSVGILFFRNYFTPELNWLNFIIVSAYMIGFTIIILSIFSIIYFRTKEKVIPSMV